MDMILSYKEWSYLVKNNTPKCVFQVFTSHTNLKTNWFSIQQKVSLAGFKFGHTRIHGLKRIGNPVWLSD